MIYELRTYTCLPRKRAALVEEMEKLVPVLEKYGFRVVGLWTTMVGRAEHFVYMIAYESLAFREQNWPKLYEDQVFKKVLAESGPLSQFQDNVILQPTSYSPLP